jgi:hypothetical protein
VQALSDAEVELARVAAFGERLGHLLACSCMSSITSRSSSWNPC